MAIHTLKHRTYFWSLFVDHSRHRTVSHPAKMSTSGPYGAAVPLMEDQEMHDESAVGEKLPYVRRPMTMWRMFGPVAWLFTTTLLAAILLFLVAAITKKPDPNKCPDRLLEWCKRPVHSDMAQLTAGP